mmetsp:Transcript_14652/g.44018  ORF Transcript_14652/g.44018 Transcript_14652/m.44018 type:complete len:490 (-) Transcript_14652:155-1624(-)
MLDAVETALEGERESISQQDIYHSLANHRIPAVRVVYRILSKSFSTDLRSLALFRMAIAVTMLIDLYGRLDGFSFFYTDDGCFPVEQYKQVRGDRYSLHYFSGSFEWQGFLFALHAVVSVLAFFGVYTRVSWLCMWVLLISLHSRNEMVLNGGDHFFRLITFWGLFLPLGSVASVDSLSRLPRSGKDKKRRRGLLSSVKQLFGQFTQPLPENGRYFSVAVAALILQFGFMYWFTAALKSGRSWRVDFDAMEKALHNHLFSRETATLFMVLPTSVLKLMTWFTFWFEVGAPFLLFVPIFGDYFRFLTIVSVIIFHGVMGLAMSVGLFTITPMVAMLGLLPPLFWETLISWFSSSSEGVSNTPPKLSHRLYGRRRVPQEVVVLMLILVCTNWNLALQHPTWWPLPKLEPFVQMIRIDQWWAMFAPNVPSMSFWFIHRGTLKDGTKVDLFRDRKDPATISLRPDVASVRIDSVSAHRILRIATTECIQEILY